MEKKKFLIITITYLFLIFHTTFSLLHPRDFLALQSLRKYLADLPGSTFFSTWDFTSEPCNFQGVYCSSSNRVVALNLGDPRAGSPGLTGRLSPSLSDLTSLTELTIVPGRIIGSLPSNLPPSLRFLAISKNFLSGSLPPSISNLRSLQTLDLSFNQLAGSITSVRYLKSLTILLLCHNRFAGSIPTFSSSNSLTRLDLKHNYLSGSLSPYSLPSSIQYLSLSTNKLSGSVDRLLVQLTRLNYLDLSMNKFTGSIPGTIFSYPITNLQLQRNSFTGPVQPRSQVLIRIVDLSYNQLTGKVSSMFSTVENLYLNNNMFTGEVPRVLVEKLLGADMDILYLQHNYLTGIQINPTAEIPTSSSLCLQYNCMVPPLHTPCPIRAGKQKSRPEEQCKWKG